MSGEYVGVPYTPGSDTAEAAAVAMLPIADTIRRKVYELLRAAGTDGLADHEIADLLPGYAWSSTRTRRKELQEAGLVVDSGRRRPTRSGRQAVVWVAVTA